MLPFDKRVSAQGFRSTEPYLAYCAQYDAIPNLGSHKVFSAMLDDGILTEGMRIQVPGERTSGSTYIIGADGTLIDALGVVDLVPFDPRDVLDPSNAPHGWLALDLRLRR